MKLKMKMEMQMQMQMKIADTEPRERPLLEVNISAESIEDGDEYLTQWLRDHSTFAHKNQEEYIFWIPPFEHREKYLEQYYGADIPQVVQDSMAKAIGQRMDKEDAGYLLIAII